MATTTIPKTIPAAKIEAVEELVNLIKSSKVLGIAKAEGIGAKQIQRLRKLLKEVATLRVAKNTLVRLAIKKCTDEKPDITNLDAYLPGSNIFIFASMDPFKLTRILERNKMKTLAKPGQIAPEDIIVPAGNTSFPPGPLITEFSNVGLPTKIDAGNIAITRDTVVVKEGEPISKQLALVLSRLGIEPMEVGLVLEVSYEDGLLLQKEHLQIDVDEIRNQFMEASSQALNLVIYIAYPTPETIELLLRKAFMSGMCLAETSGFVTPEIMPQVIMKAHREMLALATKISSIDPSVVPQELIQTSVSPVTPPEEKKNAVKEKKTSEPTEEGDGGLGELF